MDKIFKLIEKENKRQLEGINLIPSENLTSKNVIKAIGSCLTNKYAEGYPGRRYYQGNAIIDQIEQLAIDRGKKLFGFEHLNVQPYSGSSANCEVLMGLLEVGDTICGLKLSAGGHLTHGHPKITFAGKYFRSVQYDVDADGRIDFDKLNELVQAEKTGRRRVGHGPVGVQHGRAVGGLRDGTHRERIAFRVGVVGRDGDRHRRSDLRHGIVVHRNRRQPHRHAGERAAGLDRGKSRNGNGGPVVAGRGIVRPHSQLVVHGFSGQRRAGPHVARHRQRRGPHHVGVGAADEVLDLAIDLELVATAVNRLVGTL